MLIKSAYICRYAYVAIGSHSPIHYFDRGHILTGVWRYDTATHEWTDLPQISRTVFLGGLTFSGKYLHFVGNFNTSLFLVGTS
jgi:hypothetical protein